jgi:fatty-acyl-CoA synthase
MNTVEPGLMMDFPLTTQHFLWRMSNVHPHARVTSIVDENGDAQESTLAAIAERSHRLAASLTRLGIKPGDRVGTFAFNSAAHMETYLGVMSMGAILHTINLRLHPDQLIWMVNHAEDRVVIVDAFLVGQFSALLEKMPTVKTLVVIGDVGTVDVPDDVLVLSFDELATADPGDFQFPRLDEQSAASLCYTSGTTGHPKGVLYSHRSIAVHALIMAGTEVFGVRKEDVVLATVPMFHVMGWGLPFISVLVGAHLVMPGRHLGPRSLYRAISDHGVTWSSGVPTIWMDLLRFLDTKEDGTDPAALSSIKTLILGGTQVPGDLIRRFAADFGTEVISGWGMTEIFPGATVANTDGRLPAQENLRRQVTAGRISPFYEIRLVDDSGSVVPHDGVARGEVQVRGPVVASNYFRLGDEAADKFDDGWLRTGDIATVDEEGWVTLVDRAKDMIKSGGEWISSAELEVAIQAHPLVHEAAVVGRPDPRWSERPYAFLVTSAPISLGDLRDFLEDRVPKWWIPEDFAVVPEIPRTTTGKFDKKILRKNLLQEESPA